MTVVTDISENAIVICGKMANLSQFDSDSYCDFSRPVIMLKKTSDSAQAEMLDQEDEKNAYLALDAIRRSPSAKSLLVFKHNQAAYIILGKRTIRRYFGFVL